MMTKYSKEFNDGIITKLLQSGNTVAEIATEISRENFPPTEQSD